MNAQQEFEATIKSLAEFFKAEPAAMSANTTRFGTIDRETAIRLAAQLAR